jgi:antirestriction protein ArdC
LELQALKCTELRSGAVPLGLAPALRVHRLSTYKEGHKMTTTTDRSELLAQLSEGIANLTTSDEWQRYLDCQSRFYRYSPNNVMLIAQQRHEASYVAGFNAWKKMGRFVRKGEKAIWILAPMVYKQTDEKTDEDQKVIRGFKLVPVFDIASTDGGELPTICNRLTGDDPSGLYSRLIEVAQSIGFTVEDAELPGSVNGDCSHMEHRIRVEITNSPAQRVKTLAHEIGHALLHEKYDNRALAELEAESTAYVICQALGLDTSDYSFGYVATWAGGGDQAIAGIKASCERIQKAAATVLKTFEVELGVAA